MHVTDKARLPQRPAAVTGLPCTSHEARDYGISLGLGALCGARLQVNLSPIVRFAGGHQQRLKNIARPTDVIDTKDRLSSGRSHTLVSSVTRRASPAKLVWTSSNRRHTSHGTLDPRKQPRCRGTKGARRRVGSACLVPITSKVEEQEVAAGRPDFLITAQQRCYHQHLVHNRVE
ncbi:hypothetical protein ANO11243_032740 [Dothideomycetidae sp. 11243]|nr:hypothetical protein ANO11243_032740 [fungal sp. No.11243]